ncbi:MULTISPECIES: type II toxin-antitoxin system HigA family antitoxin [unclassified Okeania]|uniref:helix-turn-helix domain-containing protein n=1 Tax=unclassified Okeania TaxID=2634635 RepID=UPI0013B5C534|nr:MULTISPECIES: transcriptional regulator [unclassified Okeania]NES78071.1 transcriptional regulator [Okeania sp. SIO1H4]NET22567.1 transcriptional regulator [Okeania sp. SIO1H5]NET95692.1 transcriptional regulator [Okeania sp. SIO1H2]
MTKFPPRPITNETELIATQNRINSILDKSSLTKDDRDYLKVLGMLVYEYEEENEPIPTISGVEILKALLEESQLSPQDLVPILGNEFMVLEVLNGKCQLSENQIQELANFFNISPSLLTNVA